MDKHVEVLSEVSGIASSPLTPQIFASAGQEHMDKYGTKPEHFAKIAEKNHRHSVNNPNSQFRDEYTLQDILKSKMVHEPLTKLQCCPTSDGSAAAIVCSESFVRRHNLQSKAVEIVAMTMRTDFPSTFKEKSGMKLVGYDMTKAAAEEIYRKTGYRPQDIDVIELHDCFSCNELITYEALGLCPPGKAGEMIDRGDNTYGGKYVINPSGGLISKGHPLGATGLAQCAELCWQLRGAAGKRQVASAKVALQHNLGLGGAVVVTLYRLGFPQQANRSNIKTTVSSSTTGATMKCTPFFDEVETRMKTEGSSMVKKIKGSFLFKITGGDGKVHEWLVDLKSGSGSVTKGTGLKGDCTIIMKDGDFMDMITGKIGAQKAFFSGKLKITGNTGLAMKLQSIMPEKPKSKL
ncbi:PREDICTED: non-specific lipid-transfer protein-like [Amphimedon queenslandica]|nr:PREDICTED: non-specific lipid-transfer protein-like [Amphimedon queenslandica]|eukprot:XP_019851926.1 PREDICTED: non-specific lipid-transfer protein-like [Amphimedon queenslandica]